MGVSANTDYLKSFPGILKIIQFVLLLGALGCMAQILKDSNEIDGKFAFFLAAMVVGVIVVILLFILHILKYSAFTVTFLVEKKIGKSKWNAILLVLHLLVAVLCVVSSALLVKTASDWIKYGLNDFRWDHLVAALVFGFVSFALFMVDVVLAVKNMRG